MDKLKRFDAYLRRCSLLKLILTIWGLTYIAVSPVIIIKVITGEPSLMQAFDVGNINIAQLIVIGLFISPFFETLLFQTLFFTLLEKLAWFRSNQWMTIILSATVFGLAHNYSNLYIFYGLLNGLVLAYGYTIFRWRNEGPYLMISLIHLLRNAVAILLFIMGG